MKMCSSAAHETEDKDIKCSFNASVVFMTKDGNDVVLS